MPHKTQDTRRLSAFMYKTDAQARDSKSIPTEWISFLWITPDFSNAN